MTKKGTDKMRVGSSNFNTIDVAISGMRGQGKRMKDISSNIANIGRGTAGGGGAVSDPHAATGLGRSVTIDDLPSQMIEINSATRTYKANVAVLKRYEQMVETTLELLR
jgi:flagellar basal body rod protein FlgC